MSIDFALIVNSIPDMLEGLGLTLLLLFLSAVLGLTLAITLLLMRISGRWYLAAPTMVYIYVFRGTPILVQLFIIYHGLPQLVRVAPLLMRSVPLLKVRVPFSVDESSSVRLLLMLIVASDEVCK